MKTLNTIIWQEVKYIPYANDKKFFKIVDKDLYYNIGTIENPQYDLLKKDFMKVDKN
jgi:hypothetical protein